jgi:hypothetical protein
MRGEVGILSRNIVIKGDGVDDWGGQVLTTDSLELSNVGESVFRYGETVLEYRVRTREKGKLSAK